MSSSNYIGFYHGPAYNYEDDEVYLLIHQLCVGREASMWPGAKVVHLVPLQSPDVFLGDLAYLTPLESPEQVSDLHQEVLEAINELPPIQAEWWSDLLNQEEE